MKKKGFMYVVCCSRNWRFKGWFWTDKQHKTDVIMDISNTPSMRNSIPTSKAFQSSSF